MTASKSEYQRLVEEESHQESSYLVDQPPPTFSEAVASSSKPPAGPDGSGSSQDEDIPPPDFTTYTAEQSAVTDGNIISHDPHLNEDGEALYRFLLSNAFQKPELLIHCRGTHQEHRTRIVTSHENGRTTTHTETYTETIVDFDFWIDASSAILSEQEDTPVIWTVGDLEPAYRGKLVRELDNTPMLPEDIEVGDIRTALVRHPVGLFTNLKRHRRRATRKERKEADIWDERRRQWGYPPWVKVRGQPVGMEAGVESDEVRNRIRGTLEPPCSGWYQDEDVHKPTRTLRQWSDEYCASNKILKEFVFQKVLYGWNVEALSSAIKQTLRSASSSETQTVDIVVNGAQVIVRPDTALSRALTKTWVKILLWITLIFPLFIWPFKRFHSRGGGEWRVCGSAFAVVKWKHLEDSFPGETVEEYKARTRKVGKLPEDFALIGSEDMKKVDNPARSHASNSEALARLDLAPDHKEPILKETEAGISQLIGKREGEWFREWEDTISSAAATHLRNREPLRYPDGRSRYRTAGLRLAGYL